MAWAFSNKNESNEQIKGYLKKQQNLQPNEITKMFQVVLWLAAAEVESSGRKFF